jgi:hypothetical protein
MRGFKGAAIFTPKIKKTVLLLAPLLDSGVDFKFLFDNIIMMLMPWLQKVPILMPPKIVLLVAPLFETCVKMATKFHL